MREAGFETGAHLTVKISDGCIVLIRYSEEVDGLKHEQALLRQQLRDVKQVNLHINSLLCGMTNQVKKSGKIW